MSKDVKVKRHESRIPETHVRREGEKLEQDPVEPEVDKTRILHKELRDLTGIYVRAKHDGRWGSYDIAVLTAESLRAWLRSKAGKSPFNEDIIGIVLGHGHLNKENHS